MYVDYQVAIDNRAVGSPAGPGCSMRRWWRSCHEAQSKPAAVSSTWKTAEFSRLCLLQADTDWSH
jgi:hypothetical protein